MYDHKTEKSRTSDLTIASTQDGVEQKQQYYETQAVGWLQIAD
jgi:hypothetical protein